MDQQHLFGKGALEWIVGYTGLVAEAIAVALIIFAVVQAGWSIVRMSLSRVEDEHPWIGVRLGLARWLAMSLEFLLAADIVRTAVAPTWEDIGKLGAIAVIRTGLNFFLRREMQDERRERTEGEDAERHSPRETRQRAA